MKDRTLTTPSMIKIVYSVYSTVLSKYFILYTE